MFAAEALPLFIDQHSHWQGNPKSPAIMYIYISINQIQSKGFSVPYRAIFGGYIPLHRPDMVGTSNKSVPEMAVEYTSLTVSPAMTSKKRCRQ
jgi:hypothetical protein